jgi:hypothetical protein
MSLQIQFLTEFEGFLILNNCYDNKMNVASVHSQRSV